MTKADCIYYLLEHFPQLHNKAYFKSLECFFDTWIDKKTIERLFIVVRLVCSVWLEIPESFTPEERKILEDERKLFDSLGVELSGIKGHEIIFLPELERSASE